MKTKFILIVVAITFMSYGCTALQPFPNLARGGDTIALAAGSPKDMSRSNTTATFTSSVDASVVDLTPNIRSIFNLYADQASEVYQYGSNTGSLVESSSHDPWLTIVAIDLPVGITPGSGYINLTTTAEYPDIGSHINNLDIPIEIVAGTGTPHTFPYEFGIGASKTGNLSVLEPLPRAVYGPNIPSINCPCPNYAAIEVKTSIPTSLGALQEAFLRVIPADLTVNTASGRSVLHGISNGNDLTVIFTSQSGNLNYQEAQFTVALHKTITFSGTPVINSVRYYDINGAEVAGPVADYAVTLK